MTGFLTTDCSVSIPGGRRRTAFTLVEMIVVMAIIGALAAILIPTLRAAMVRAKVTAIAGDLANLDAAISQFKEKYGDYPPDFSNRQVLVRHVQKAWPRVTVKEMRIFLATTLDDPRWRVDRAEALVFWLSGFSEDPLHPFTGSGGPFSGGERNQDTAFFPFDNNRLTESTSVLPCTVTLQGGGTYTFRARESTDDKLLYGNDKINDPFPVCLTRGTNLPIVYIDAHYYRYSSYPEHGVGAVFTGHAHAYLSERKRLNPKDTDNSGALDPEEVFEFVNPHSYQLIAAGLDEDYGVDDVGFKQFGTGVNFTPGDLDNITNFSGGTLEDANP